MIFRLSADRRDGQVRPARKGCDPPFDNWNRVHSLPPHSKPPVPPTGTNPYHLHMPEIQVKKGEPIDRALKRLKSKIETESILEEFRRRRQHETPMERSKRKARSAAKKKNQKYRFVP